MSAALKFERGVRADLHRRRWVRIHVFLIGLVTFGVLWGVSHTLMMAGIDSMALRHGTALLGAYMVYLGLLWAWCRWLISRDEGSVDIGDPGFDLPSLASDGAGSADSPVFRSGGGGDFGGGGAGGSFDAPHAVGETVSAAADAGSSAAGEAVAAVAEAVGSADEGAVVLVPVALAIGVAVALAAVLGFAVFGLFGVEVLIGVAVEIAFASAGGALALKAQRQGWLGHAVRRTVGPMAIVLAVTVLTGLAIGHWLPESKTLPEALQRLF
ncbi:MAG TPA: hypothetical protein VLI72_16095 [Methylibium sp.]|nr:hypothetical protein [Methylibium sp.]